jgi:hypothetical protein
MNSYHACDYTHCCVQGGQNTPFIIAVQSEPGNDLEVRVTSTACAQGTAAWMDS